MELNEAIAKVQGMKNLFRSFERVEEVLQLAESAGQLVKERNEQADKLVGRIEDLKAEVAVLSAVASTARADMHQERQKHELALVEAEKAASEMRAGRLQEFETNFTRALQLADEHQKRAEADIRVLNAEKQSLESKVSELRNELASLKSRIAGA